MLKTTNIRGSVKFIPATVREDTRCILVSVGTNVHPLLIFAEFLT